MVRIFSKLDDVSLKSKTSLPPCKLAVYSLALVEDLNLITVKKYRGVQLKELTIRKKSKIENSKTLIFQKHQFAIKRNN